MGAYKYGTEILTVGPTDTIRIRRDAPLLADKLWDNNKIITSSDFVVEVLVGSGIGIRFIGQNDPNPVNSRLARYTHIYDEETDENRWPMYILTPARQFVSIKGLQLYDLELVGATTSSVAKGYPGAWGASDAIVQILLTRG